MKNKKICIYTCITGNYDSVNKIPKKEKNIDYLLFTNNRELKSKDWKVIYIDNNGLDNQRLSRKIKMLGHEIINKNYDLSIWTDATVIFKKSVNEFVQEYYNEKIPFSSFVHHSRNCIYAEAEECLKQRKDTKKSLESHIEFLKKEKYPKNNGLYEMTVFIKNHNDKKVKETMELWFNMVCNHSKRDQLSFMYCVWKTKMNINPINLNVWNNEWFKCNNHKNFEKTLRTYRVYFDDEKEYKMDNDFQGEFANKSDKYTLDLCVPENVKKTIIELPKTPFIRIKDIIINEKKTNKIHFFNEMKIFDSIIFYNENGAFEIYDEFKKNSKLKIELTMEKMNEEDISILLKNIEKEINTIRYEKEKNDDANNQLMIENKKLNDELRKILNSTSWKFISKISKLKIKRKEKNK